ncbi:ubiquinone biosynthesis protein COQ4 homolog, mitochondrial-like isoform X2 [Vespula pensylvanica]|uniref:ubiquinone biosynthesis protein COQ4 homolog, mitochondrial-like isoform X2 n=1 Tax=Vespula pensylvanica TaxID=30213 RepID=UPI001CBA1F60|nr:ubiquinone biosynthesis protein COQ4 homolog, mitochondrial-like isoform X2 [Vespula pensylvanica]
MLINQQNAMFVRVGSALFYGLSSFMITVVNKMVLTTFGFPSFQVLGIGQMLATIFVLYLAKKLHYVDFPNLEAATFVKIWPLPMIYIGNMIFGLAVRRFSAYKAFEEDYAKHHIFLSSFQRAALSVGSAIISLADPSRGDLIACLAETTSGNALVHCLNEMQKSSEGQRILKEKPRINTSTVDLSLLKNLPEGTLGKTYSNFLEVNNVTPDSRTPTRFIDDVEQAYVMQRYREIHDISHAVLLMPTTMLGEVTVKWVEALQTKLPMCIGGAIFGAARLRARQRKLYLDYYLRWAVNTGNNAKFLLGVYFEERWEQSLQDFHKEMNIVPLIPMS